MKSRFIESVHFTLYKEFKMKWRNEWLKKLNNKMSDNMKNALECIKNSPKL